MDALFFMGVTCGEEQKPSPSDNSLETGIIREGGASALHRTGTAHFVDNGTEYGGGRRYEHTEIPCITKVRSRHNNG
jgi:hypothetical protein